VGVPQTSDQAKPRVAYSAAQEARLKTLAQLVATWIKRDVDAKLKSSRRVK
jgi:hypothetical protein